jgi:hypothetical protein
MRTKIGSAAIGVIVLAVIVGIAWAQSVPQLINYQGRLMNSAGQPINGNTIEMHFRLMEGDTLTANILWGETHSAVSVRQGLYNVILGSVNPIPASVFAGSTVFLEVVIQGEIQRPRPRMTSVPWSFNSSLLDGKDSTQFSSSSHKHYVSTVVVSPVPGDPEASGSALLNVMASTNHDASSQRPYLLKIEPGIYNLGAVALMPWPYVDVEGSGVGVTTIQGQSKPTMESGTVVLSCDGHCELRDLTVSNDGWLVAEPGHYSIGIYSVDSARIKNVSVTATYGASGTFGIRHVAGILYLENVDIGAGTALDIISEVSGIYAEAPVHLKNCHVYGGQGSMTFQTIPLVSGIHSSGDWGSISAEGTEITAGGNDAYHLAGIYKESYYLDIKDSQIIVNGFGDFSGFETDLIEGISNFNGVAKIVNSEVEVSDGKNVYGIVNRSMEQVDIINTNIRAHVVYGMIDQDNSVGIVNSDSNAAINRCNIEAGDATAAYAIKNSDGSLKTITIDQSKIKGHSFSVYTNANHAVKVGASQLIGPVFNNVGTITCIGVYDGNYQNANGFTSCP